MIKQIFENLFKPLPEEELKKRYDALSDDEKKEGADRILHLSMDTAMDEAEYEVIVGVCNRFGIDKKSIDWKKLSPHRSDPDAIADLLLPLVSDESLFKMFKEDGEYFG